MTANNAFEPDAGQQRSALWRAAQRERYVSFAHIGRLCEN